MLRTPDESTADTDLWVLNFTDTWYSPGTDTVVHQSDHPLLVHGYANAYVLAKVAKIRLMNGATELHNYSDVLNLTMADWNNRSGVGEWDFTDSLTDFSTFRFRVGDAVKIEGDTPSNIPDGHFFQITKTQDMGGWAGGGRAGEITQLPYLGLAWKGVWSSRGGNGAGQFNNMPPGTGGGDHTMTSYTLILDKHVLALRDDDGAEVWSVGGATVEPCWTRAEKIRRMQTGQIPSIPIEEFPENLPGSPFQGLESNAPKNTSGIPAYQHLHAYGPGRTLYHRSELNNSGVGYSQGNHLNECSIIMWDVLNDMANPDVPFWRMHKIAAAESISLVPINCFDHNTVSGNKIAMPFCLNNGPDADGVAYPGMGPCQPTASYGTVRKARGSGTGSDQQNEMSYYPSLGVTGSHSTKEMAFSYVLRCYPTDLVGIQQLWSLVHSQYQDNAAPLYGRNKTHNGIDYYSAGMLGTGTFTEGQVRSWIGWNYFLSFCLYTPDSEPHSQYFKDVANTSIDYFDAVIQDPTVMGTRALKIGPIQSMPGGGNQFWVLGRHLTAATYLLKRSGRTGAGPERVLNYLTAMPRALWGAPEGGGTPWTQATGDGYTGYTGFVFSGRLFDKANDVSDPASTDPLATVVRFLDDASSVTDGSNIILGLNSNTGNYPLAANTDSTITINSISNAATHTPVEGDSVIFGRDPNESGGWPPTELASGTRFWMYDFSGSTCKLSSTPGPSFTQATWTLASTRQIHRNCIVVDFATRRAGSVGPNGLLGIMQQWFPAQTNLEYLYEAWGAVPCANTMFGAAHTEDAIALHDTFRARVKDPLQDEHDYHNRGWSNMSWAMFEHYGPGAT